MGSACQWGDARERRGASRGGEEWAARLGRAGAVEKKRARDARGCRPSAGQAGRDAGLGRGMRVRWQTGPRGFGWAGMAWAAELGWWVWVVGLGFGFLSFSISYSSPF